MTEGPYNPLDRINLGKSVAEAVLDKEPVQLGSIPAFNGAGIYAIYYRGPFMAYKRMAKRNRERVEWPIYVGKAIPAGGRKGAGNPGAIGPALRSRLEEHAETIRVTENLDVDDFQCRYLTVDDIWIPLAETLLIARFKPVWNLLIEGFGNHDPGAGRYKGLRPRWDVLHPGRPWAARCQVRPESAEQLASRVVEFLAGNEPPPDPRFRFVGETAT